MLTQVPTRCKLTIIMDLDHSISLWISNQAREMSGREYAQLKRMLGCQNIQERAPLAGQTCIYRDTPSNRAVGQKSGAPDAPTHRPRMHSAASGAPDLATCLTRSKFNSRFSEHRTRPTPSTQSLMPSVRCTPVSNQRRFSLTGHIRRWENERHCVWCTRGFEEAAYVM
jgi:hypothetical protein